MIRWFTVATRSESCIKMACALSKLWSRFNNSEMVVVTDSDFPAQNGVPSLVIKNWDMPPRWEWYFKFLAYDAIVQVDKSDIFCFMDCDVLPVKPIHTADVRDLAADGAHIAMEEDMINDGVSSWWSYDCKKLGEFMRKNTSSRHGTEVNYAWHGNGGFSLWHRDLIKNGKFINRANELFLQFEKLADSSGGGRPCDEVVMQTMVQEVVKPNRVFAHTLADGVTKNIQETVFWPEIPKGPTRIEKTSYFTGKRRWSCEPSVIHMIHAKQKLTELATQELMQEESNTKVFDFIIRNVRMDALTAKKINGFVSVDNYEIMTLSESPEKFGCKVDYIPSPHFAARIDGMRKKNFSFGIICEHIAHKLDEQEIRHIVESIRNGGIFLIFNDQNKLHAWKDLNPCLGLPHGHINRMYTAYYVDVLRRRWKEKPSMQSVRNR